MIREIEKTAVDACPCCNAVDSRPLFDVREHEYDNTTDDVFHFHVCGKCTAWYLDPRPALSALDVIYPANYYAHADETSASGKLGDGLVERLFRARMTPYERNTELGPDTSWFEIGCGQGEFLERLRRYYGVQDITGIDFSESSVAFCRKKGIEAHAVSFEDYEPGPGETYDIVHSSHVIEHVASPRRYMEKARSLLEPGGLCVFDTPNTAAWEAGFFGPLWGGLHAPRHWTLLNPAAAAQLGEATGFRHRDTLFFGSSHFWIWSLHHTLERWLGRRIADWAFPSDHRINDSGPIGVLRTGALTVAEALLIRWLRRSANMSVVFEKVA